MLWLVRFGLLGQTFTYTHALRFLLLAIVLCTIAGVAGWLGARYIGLGSAVGILAGLTWMATATRDATGWEDLIGLIGFWFASAFGLAAGVIAELVAAIVRLLTRRSSKRG